MLIDLAFNYFRTYLRNTNFEDEEEHEYEYEVRLRSLASSSSSSSFSSSLHIVKKFFQMLAKSQEFLFSKPNGPNRLNRLQAYI